MVEEGKSEDAELAKGRDLNFVWASSVLYTEFLLISSCLLTLSLVITILLLPSLPTKCFISGTLQLTLEQHRSWCHQPMWTQLKSWSAHHTAPSSSVSPPGIQPTPDRVGLLYLLLKRIYANVDLLNSNPCSIVVSFRIKKKKIVSISLLRFSTFHSWWVYSLLLYSP